MQLLPGCRNALLFKNSFIQLTSSIHTTSTSFEKWKNKWNSDVKGQQPSKTYVRYTTRQKRADAKRALNDLLFNNGSSKISFEEEFLKGDRTRRWDGDHTDQSDSTNKKDRSKSSARRTSKAHQKRMKCKPKRENFSHDFDDGPGRIFEAPFGNRWYTWSFKSWEESFSQSSTTGFEWRENSNRTNHRNKEWKTLSDEDSSDDESCVVGPCSDRIILGLPPKGPLNIKDVKNAFRLSALKWHPDKHQGSSQAMAEEKFKSCVSAYKSLCNAISGA